MNFLTSIFTRKKRFIQVGNHFVNLELISQITIRSNKVLVWFSELYINQEVIPGHHHLEYEYGDSRRSQRQLRRLRRRILRAKW